ncbi:MAG: hypothetical protein NTY00_11400 [Deltaproteobacteria bacterium]|nr:hypothetical protein [Deltaproteobacteria bacterium]
MPILPARQGIAELPPDSFFRLFVKLNQLDQVAHFLFLPGMLFNDAKQWWRSKSMRPHPHEGIDLYLMQDVETGVKNVLPQMLIPAILSGQLVHFHRDFLGETLYIRHPEIRQGNAVLHTIYGHVQSSADLSCPAVINKGQIVGRISPPPGTTPVPAHLHISCAWIQEDQQVEGLNWKNMTGNANVYFIDPIPFLMQ